MDTRTLAAAIAGFILGGLVVATAAQLERDDAPTHGAPSRVLWSPPLTTRADAGNRAQRHTG